MELLFAQSFLFQLKWFVIGFISWTLGEYILHRFFYHDPIDGSYMKGFHYVFHGVHHEYPRDKSKVVIPVVPGLLIAAVLQSIFLLAFWLVSSSGALALVFNSGFLVGYLCYMMIHYSVHHFPTPKRYNFWWVHHNIHHFQQPDRAFGVSTPIWDYVFRTMPEKGRRVTQEQLN